MMLPDPDWDAVVDLSWSGAPVVLRLGDPDRTAWVLKRVRRVLEPARIILFLPGLRASRRRRAYEAAREKLDAALQHSMPAQLNRARYICFDAEWRGHLVNSQGLSIWARFKLLTHFAARRISAPSVQYVFDEHQRRVPGMKFATWFKVAMPVVLLILLVASLGSPDGTPPIDVTVRPTEAWEGLAWGSSSSEVGKYFASVRRLDVDPFSTRIQSVDAETQRTFAGIEMPLHLQFLRGRLVGAGLRIDPARMDQLPRVRAALTQWLGTPTGSDDDPRWGGEPVVARIAGDENLRVVQFVNVKLVRELGGQ
jgi:hypothetical protein